MSSLTRHSLISSTSTAGRSTSRRPCARAWATRETPAGAIGPTPATHRGRLAGVSENVGPVSGWPAAALAIVIGGYDHACWMATLPFPDPWSGPHAGSTSRSARGVIVRFQSCLFILRLCRPSNRSLSARRIPAGKRFVEARDRAAFFPVGPPSPAAETGSAGSNRGNGAEIRGACQRAQETVFARDWVVGSSLPTQVGNRRGEYGRRRPRFPDAALALDRSRRRRADLDQITGRPETCRRSAFVQQGRRQAVDKHHLPARRLRRNPIRATAPGRRCR